MSNPTDQIRKDFRQMLLDRIGDGAVSIETLMDRVIEHTPVHAMAHELGELEYGEYANGDPLAEVPFPQQQQHLFRNAETGHTAVWTMQDAVEAGTPVDPETGDDLEYVGPVSPAPTIKPKVKVIVGMHGGCIDQVTFDQPDVEITDVIFVESDNSNGEVEDEFFVMEGDIETDEFIYTHHVNIDLADHAYVDRVMEAAHRRSKASEQS